MHAIGTVICSLNSSEVMNGFPERMLDCNGYKIELEKSDIKKRVGVYFRQNIEYIRRDDLEQKDLHIVICDVLCDPKIRIISLYRSFHPPGGLTVTNFFNAQLAVIM